MSPHAFDGPTLPLTEARIAQARRLVEEGEIATDKAGRRSWRDELCRGLALVVSARGASFYFQGTVNGRTVRRAIGDVETVRLEEARQAVGRLRFDRSVAGVLAPRAAGEAGDANVGEVVEAMLAAHESGRWLPGTRTRVPTDRTMKFYRDLRAARLKDHEALTLSEFAAALPAEYAKIRSEAPYQANRFLQLVRNLYSYAIDSGAWSAANPAAGTSRTDRLTRTPELPRTRTLSDAEWAKLTKAMKGAPQIWGHLFTVSLYTGQRIGACRHMRWHDLTLTGRDAAWKIPAQWMKGRKAGHTIPLADLPEVLAILRARRPMVPKSCEWVFPGDDGEPVRSIDKAWKKILKAAGLLHEDSDRRPRPHDLRRTAGARMTAAGTPLQTVTRALGNSASSAAMVGKVYAQVGDEALRAAFKAAAKKTRGRKT